MSADVFEKHGGLIIESQETVWRSEEGAVVTPFEGGGLRISVAEEKAVDSYNDSFTCSITMSRGQAEVLARWLLMYLYGEPWNR